MGQRKEIPAMAGAGKPQPERHPLAPFLPVNAVLLMLGSFPPPHERWSMEFFYPNLQNDMWRIFGLAFFGDRDHFVVPGGKLFDRERIISFLQERGIALSDTARAVVRHRGNASDKFLEIVEAADVAAMLREMPLCRAIATTGELASQTLAEITSSSQPGVGKFAEFTFAGRQMRHYRMPSSSRAYPKPLAEKAEAYAELFRAAGIL
jgi:G:T/U-mismatch repair DNA glycosylase